MISIKITGIESIRKKLGSASYQLDHALSEAGTKAGMEIVKQKGIAAYPPSTAANRPPIPYYIRGRGTETKTGNKLNSQNLGRQWTVVPIRGGARVENKVSYAKYVHGTEQAKSMATIGWRKLETVAQQSVGKIKQHFINSIKKLFQSMS